MSKFLVIQQDHGKMQGNWFESPIGVAATPHVGNHLVMQLTLAQGQRLRGEEMPSLSYYIKELTPALERWASSKLTTDCGVLPQFTGYADTEPRVMWSSVCKIGKTVQGVVLSPRERLVPTGYARYACVLLQEQEGFHTVMSHDYGVLPHLRHLATVLH